MFREKLIFGLGLLLLATPVFGGVEIVEKVCRKMRVTDCNFIKAVAWAESGYRNITVPDKGSLSYGPMQIKCLTARQMGFLYDCKDLMIAEVSLVYAVRYLQYQLRRYGTYDEAVSAYNAGTAFRCERKCPRGRLINHDHVMRVKARYVWLKNKSPRILDRFLASFNSWGGLESSTTPSKRAYPTSLAYMKDAHLEWK